MSTYFLAVGVNRYTDNAYPELQFCENDATELQALFKRNLKLGERARKLIGSVRLDDVAKEIQEIGRKIRNGDTFVFFFAGHGYEDPNHQNQFLLLPNAIAKMVNSGHTNGNLSLAYLSDLTDDWFGVTRIFILDACRDLLKGAGKRGGNAQAFNNEAGLAYIASRSPGFGPERETTSNAPIILNAARNGESARELEDLGRGALSLALERSLEDSLRSGEPIWLDDAMLRNIEQRIREMLAKKSSSLQQTPVLVPQNARAMLFKPERTAQEQQIKALLARFEEQFAREDYRTPWGDCCDHTLIQLGERGLAVSEQQALQARLQAAIERHELAQRESLWDSLLAGFEAQLAAGKLDAPVTDNCRETLLLLQTRNIPQDRLDPLRQRLQEALDQRQANSDYEHDERLISLARQHQGSSLGKSYAQTYLSTARRHKHDDEAHTIIAAVDALASDTARTRDERRRNQAENEGTLAAWERCHSEAETPELIKIAEVALQSIRQKKIDTAKRQDDEHDAGLLRDAEASPSVTTWQRCLFQARTEKLRKKAQGEIDRLEKLSESQRQESEKRDQSRLQRAIETNSFEAWEACWLNAETAAIKETAKSRMAALKAQEAAAKSQDARLLAAAKKKNTIAAWEELRSKASSHDAQQQAEREIARIEQDKIDKTNKQEQEQRDHNRFQKALQANTLTAWKECLQTAETEKLRASASDKIASIEAQQNADDSYDSKLLAEAARVKTAHAWEKVVKNAKRNEVRDRARQELSKIAAESQAARARDEKRAAAALDSQTPLAYWRKLLTEMETAWGKNQANESIETLVANDQSEWTKATGENTTKAYQRYLDTQQEGKWRYEARSRIVSIIATETSPEEEHAALTKTQKTVAITAAGLFTLFILANDSKLTSELRGWLAYHIPNAPFSATVDASKYTYGPSTSAQDVNVGNHADILTWEATTRTIQSSRWWTSPQGEKIQQMPDENKSWVKQTIQYAAVDEPLPLAQLMLASLQCRGIAAPLVPLDPQACGKTLAKALTNPKLSSSGQSADKLEEGVGKLFDKWVPTSGQKVNRAFAQAIAPGLVAVRTQYPYLALRLALLQTCYLQPTDTAAALKTLKGIVTTANGKPAETAKLMLNDLERSKPNISWCRG